MINARLNNMTM